MLDLPIEPGRAKYWVEVAEKAVPHNDIVFKLREKMLESTEGEKRLERLERGTAVR